MGKLSEYIGKKDDLIRLLRRYSGLAFLIDLHEKASGDYVGLIAAGIAFYFLLAAFPAIGALISLYGLIADPGSITDHFDYFARFLPRDVYVILTEQAA